MSSTKTGAKKNAAQATIGRRVVLTGGPCAGKTTIAQVLERAFATDLVIMPESASLLFKGGFPRWGEEEARTCLQRSIYAVQCQMESMFMSHYPDKVIVMDRGTIDGAAYWPKGPDEYFRVLGSSLQTELQRYDRVIFLESAGKDAYDRNRTRNPARTESWDEARALDETTRKLWEQHPDIQIIRNNTAFSEKIAAVLRVIEEVIHGNR